MPNPNNAPDPQNVYILEDFFHGQDVDQALRKADELNETKLDFLQAAENAVEEKKVESVQQIINTVTVVERVVKQIPVAGEFKYGTSISLDWNPATYTLTTQLVDQEGNALGEQTTVALPYGSIVLDGHYANGQIVLKLSNGDSFNVPVSEFCAGLQPAIDADHKVNADFIDDSTSTHKFITAAEKLKVTSALNDVGADLTIIDNVADGSRKVTHANANVTPVASPAFNKVAYDAKGHITGSQPVSKADLLTLNLNGADVFLDGYTKAQAVVPITSAKSVNEAIGILEKAVEASSSKVYSNSTAGWNAQPTLISEEKAIYVYTDYDSASGSNIPAMKIGDGITAVVALPFSAANGITVDSITAWNSKMAGDVTINSKPVADSPTLDGNDIELTGYEKPAATSSILETDTVNEAIGKLEKAVEDAGSGNTYSNSSAGWAAQPTLVSELNAIYVYTDFDSADGRHIPAMKIGDGVTRVVELPFSAANGVTATKIAEWDSKVSAALSTSGDTLLLY